MKETDDIIGLAIRYMKELNVRYAEDLDKVLDELERRRDTHERYDQM